jgi:hypothetical protein
VRVYIFMSICLLVLYAVLGGEGKAEKSETEKTSEARYLIIDDFNQKKSKRDYRPYMRGDVVLEQEGYGIYHRGRANVRLTRVSVNNEDDSALQIQFRLDPIYWYDQWVTIRRDLTAPLDLSKYDGLELEFKVIEAPKNAMLRITISDVATLEDAMYHGRDEMWWYDFKANTLDNPTRKWVVHRAPLSEFDLASGVGTRKNNYIADFDRVVGYELNLIAERSGHVGGVILVNSIRAYKD